MLAGWYRVVRQAIFAACLFLVTVHAQEDEFGVRGATHTVVRLAPGGHTVGSYWSGSDLRGYLQSPGVFVSFHDLESTETVAFGVNRAGTAVGGYRDTLGRVHGFVWHQGKRTVLDAPGGTDTVAFGIGEAGDVVGAYQSADCRVHGFRWNASAGFISIDADATDATTVATGIGSNGDVVGAYRDLRPGGSCSPFPLSDTFASQGRAFVMRENVFSRIDVPDARNSIALGFNAAGEVVGQYQDATDKVRGFAVRAGGIETFDLNQQDAASRLASRANWFFPIPRER